MRSAGINTVLLSQYQEIINERGEVDKQYVELTRQSIQQVESRFGQVYNVVPMSASIPPYMSSQDSIQTQQIVDMDFDNLTDYYNADLMTVLDSDGNDISRLPSAQFSSQYIEILISDYTADQIMNVGARFDIIKDGTTVDEDGNTIDNIIDNGIVLPNSGYGKIINKQYNTNGIVFKIVGIYNTNYKQLIDDDNKEIAQSKKDFYTQFVLSNVLVYRNALSNFMNAQLALPMDIIFSAGLNFQDFHDTFVAMSSETKFAVGSDLELSMSQLFDIFEASQQMKWLDGYGWNNGTFRELADDEIVLSFDSLGTVRDWQNISGDFSKLSKEQFDISLTARFSDFYNDGSRAPYANKLKVVGVFDNQNIDISLLQTFYPNINSGILRTLVFANNQTIKNFIDESVLYTGAFMNINLNSNGTKILQELSNLQIDAMTYMMADIMFINQLFVLLSTILGYTSIGLFLFVIFLVFNFMSSSVSNKKREIGILRVMGAKGRDTAKIFIIEGLILFAITAIITIVATVIGVHFLNLELTSRFATISKVLVVGPVTIILAALAFAVSIFVASAIPLWRIIKLRPIQAVKN